MQQYVIIAKDGVDDEAINRRLAVRAQHLEGASILKQQNNFIIGGAMLNKQGIMCGSVMIVQFETEHEFENWKRNEPYIINGVWQHIEIMPFKVAQVE